MYLKNITICLRITKITNTNQNRVKLNTNPEGAPIINKRKNSNGNAAINMRIL